MFCVKDNLRDIRVTCDGEHVMTVDKRLKIGERDITTDDVLDIAKMSYPVISVFANNDIQIMFNCNDHVDSFHSLDDLIIFLKIFNKYNFIDYVDSCVWILGLGCDGNKKIIYSESIDDNLK